MAVFLSAIVLSGSRLAIERKEKEMIQWFSEQDDAIRGRGYNGFDICDMPWEKETFEKEWRFLIKVIDDAKDYPNCDEKSKEVKEKLLYEYPDESHADCEIWAIWKMK
ncbi:MAG: hypothetical protein AB6733_08875 [Clostridiaceae bacterium]